VSFSIGFNCTAYIKEADSATFLYRYPASSLAGLMDTEIRAMIQSEASGSCGLDDMDILRGKKKDVINQVRKTVIPFFAERGITITTIGMFGGFTYKNPKIQDAIDKTFVSQQEKVVAEAVFDAQQKKNETIEKAAIGLKNAAITKAEGEAEAIEIAAKAEAAAILAVAEAANKANSNPVFLKLKQLEVEESRISKWDGVYPKWYMAGNGDSPQIMLQGSPE